MRSIVRAVAARWVKPIFHATHDLSYWPHFPQAFTCSTCGIEWEAAPLDTVQHARLHTRQDKP